MTPLLCVCDVDAKRLTSGDEQFRYSRRQISWRIEYFDQLDAHTVSGDDVDLTQRHVQGLTQRGNHRRICLTVHSGRGDGHDECVLPPGSSDERAFRPGLYPNRKAHGGHHTAVDHSLKGPNNLLSVSGTSTLCVTDPMRAAAPMPRHHGPDQATHQPAWRPHTLGPPHVGGLT